MPTSEKLKRVSGIMDALRAGRHINARLVAERFGVSERTGASDFAYVRELGVPVEFDRSRNTYRLTEPFENIPILTLSKGDFAAMLVAQYALEALGDHVHAVDFAGVVKRLGEHLPETVKVEPDALTRTLRIDPGGAPGDSIAHHAMLAEAAENQRVVEIEYAALSTGETTVREVEPLVLYCRQGRWYLIAHCRLREAVRSFRLGRIKEAVATRHHFARREGVEDYLSSTFGVFQDREEYAVRVRFSARQAKWVREEEWHPSQRLREVDEGSLELSMRVTGLEDVTRWVLSYGGEAEVMEPAELRQRVAREAPRMAALYANGTRGTRATSEERAGDGVEGGG